MKPAYLIALLVFLVGMTLYTFVRHGTTGAMAECSPEEVQAKLEAKQNLIILDVRTEEEFKEGHIEGARLIPVAELQKRFTELPMDTAIVIACRNGARSEDAARILKSKGYQNMKVMSGGLMGWPTGSWVTH